VTSARRAVLSVAAFALVTAVVVAARSGLAGGYGAGPFSFPHQPHLSAETVAAALGGAHKPGADRECRVCHDYGKGDASHLTGCATCHVDAAHLAVKTRDGADAASTFPHRAHLQDASISCFTCHAVRKEMGWIEFTNPEGGLGKVGANGAPGGKHGDATCADCHRAHEPLGGKVKQDDVTGDGKPCATCHAGAAAILPRKHRDHAAGGADANHTFRHEDHGGADRRCDDCHGPIRASKSIWDYDPTAGTADACRTCHVDAAGKPLVGVAQSRTTLPFVAFSRFPHDKHLGPGEGKIATSGKVTDGCRTCHFPEKDAAAWKLFPGRQISQEPVGRDALVDYEACTPCHASWKVEGHGVGEWACFKCHEGTAGADGKLAIRKADVRRWRNVRASFETHAHPGITRAGGALADGHDGGKPCRDCHVRDVERITSRVDGSFGHAPHVRGDPRTADCLACHPTAATASWSADLLRFDRAASATASGPSAKACSDCHVGGRAKLTSETSTGGRVVPEFDHKSHTMSAKWKGGVGVPCAECHAASVVEDGTDYATAADAANCTRCHSHDEKQPEKRARTGPSSSSPDAAKACVHCHEDVTQPAADVARDRTHLSLLSGQQHHDKTGTCASCHAREGQTYAYRERIASAKVAQSIHEDAALAGQWFNDPRIAQTPDAQGRSCASCHRSEPRGYLRALSRR
jgi:hypothetical protein